MVLVLMGSKPLPQIAGRNPFCISLLNMMFCECGTFISHFLLDENFMFNTVSRHYSFSAVS